MLIEIFGLIFSLFSISRVILRFREGKLSWGMMILWCIVWLSVVAFLLSPDRFDFVSKAIGIQRPLDFMFIIGLLLAYYLTFRMYIYIEELRSDIATVVREVALIGGKKTTKK